MPSEESLWDNLQETNEEAKWTNLNKSLADEESYWTEAVPTQEPTTEVPDVSGVAKQIEAESLRETPIGEGTIQGAYMKSLLAPSPTEDPLITDSIFTTAKNALVEGAKSTGMNLVGAGEAAMSLASGMLLFFPSKLYGLAALPWGREVANIAEEEMGKLGYQPFTEEGKAASEIMSKAFEWFLTPARNVDEEISKLNPEAGYIAGFATELLEFALTGGLVKGAKAKFKPGVRQATRILEAKKDLEIKAIEEKGKAVGEIPNDVIKKVQEKVLETEKVQAELEYQQKMDNLDYGQLIKNDLQSTTKKIQQIKGIKSQPKKAIADEVVNRANEWADRQIEKQVKVKKEKSPDTIDIKIKPKDRKKIERTVEEEVFRGPAAKREAEAAAEIDRLKIERIEEETGGVDTPDMMRTTPLTKTEAKAKGLEVEEPKPSTTTLTLKDTKELGLPEELEGLTAEQVRTFLEGKDIVIEDSFRPKELSTDSHPLRQTPEETSIKTDMFEKYAKSGELNDPGLYSSYLSNEVNRWLDGENIPIEKVREAISELAARSEDVRRDFVLEADYPENFVNWKENVDEASIWARLADRKKIEPSVDLNMMIPLDRIPEIVRETLSGIKRFKERIFNNEGMFVKDVYRNKELFDKTGFWLGKDGKWRYEIDDSKAKFKRDKTYIQGDSWFGDLGQVLDYPELYKAVPSIKNITVAVNPNLKSGSGVYVRLGGQAGDVIRLHSLNEVEVIAHELQHAVNDKVAGAFKGTSVKKLYVKDPGEMEARVTEARLGMTAKERRAEPPWETLDFMLEKEGFGLIGSHEAGTTLYDITQVPTEAAKTIIAGARKVSAYTRKARGMKAFKPAVAAKMLKESFVRNYVDRSGNIRKSLLNELGDEGYEVVQRMYLSKGASSLSASMLQQMRKEVYGGLSKGERKILDDIILDDRMIDIGKYKTEKQFKHPKGLTLANFAEHRELFPYKSVNELKDLTAQQAENISRRAKAYFEWMKKPLKDMLEAGLISEKEFTDLSSHNYRRIKLVDIYDKRYTAKVGKKKRTVYDSGVESLARGRETDIYEPSSEVMALEVFNRAYGRILNNKANQTLAEVARKDPKNQFVRVKENKGDKIPSGWNRIFMFEGGERKAIYLSPEMSKEWITSNPEMSYKMSQIVRFASGSPVLRTFATGINWGFALANLPRDIMHTWFAARKFESGKWKPIYNPSLPVYGAQMGRDLISVFSDAVHRKGRYKEYLKEGGGMEFLVHQGRILQRGRHLEGNIDKINNLMGYFGETSEILTRLAIRERVLRQGKTSQEATFAARDYMDFGQGGGVSKALDNGIPYLNAAIQGTRGMFRALKENPLSSSYKLAQFAALTSGLYIAMHKMHPESSKALKGNIDMQNNLVISLGDDFGFEDEYGQMRYPYVKIPLDPSQKFFKTLFEGATDKWLGNEVDINRIVDSLKEQSPVGVTELPPTISGVLGYVTNKDFWLNEDIWKKTDPLSYPDSKEEFIPDKTPQAFIDFGAVTGMSPERTKHVVEELTTSGTVWSYLLGQGYDAVRGLPKSQKEQHLAMTLSRIPVLKRFFGVTSPYSQFADPIEKAEENDTVNRWKQNRGLDARVEGYLYDKIVSRKEVIDYMQEFKDKKVYDRLKDRFEFQQKIKDLPNRSFWLRLKSLNVEARAVAYTDRLRNATETERKQIRDELQKVIQIGGVITKSFREEVNKLRTDR